MSTPSQLNPLVLEGNFYQDDKVIGPVKAAVLLPLDLTGLRADQTESADNRVRCLITIQGKFTVHAGLGTAKCEVDSGSQRMRVYPEDSQTTGDQTDITVTLEQ